MRARQIGAALVVAVATTWIGNARANEEAYAYRYVPIANPSGYDSFEAVKITKGGRVYGYLWSLGCDAPVLTDCRLAMGVYDKGRTTVYPNRAVFAANEKGVVGGAVVAVGTEQIEFHAALFRGAQVDLIPRLSGEASSNVSALSDSGIALVQSLDANWKATSYLLYPNGKIKIIKVSSNHINNKGTIAGITQVDVSGTVYFRSFRLDTKDNRIQILNPIAGDPQSWGLDINDRGNVLGYSFVFGGLERIGIWNNKGKFTTYFVQGTEQYPTISNTLIFNDNNLIVASATTDETSYLIPRPGVRFDLSDLTVGMPVAASLNVIRDINNRGDMVGDYFTGSSYQTFVLRRTCQR